MVEPNQFDVSKLVFKSKLTSLCLVPSTPIWKAIQGLRDKYDKHAKIWMPHSNLLFPFTLPEQLFMALPPLRGIAESIPPLKLDLSKVSYFDHGDGTSTVFVAPIDPEPIVVMQSALTKVFTAYTEQQSKTGGYIPYFTIGQASSPEQRKEIVKETKEVIKAMPGGFEMTLSHIAVAARPSVDQAFQIMEYLELEGAGAKDPASADTVARPDAAALGWYNSLASMPGLDPLGMEDEVVIAPEPVKKKTDDMGTLSPKINHLMGVAPASNDASATPASSKKNKSSRKTAATASGSGLNKSGGRKSPSRRSPAKSRASGMSRLTKADKAERSGDRKASDRKTSRHKSSAASGKGGSAPPPVPPRSKGNAIPAAARVNADFVSGAGSTALASSGAATAKVSGSGGLKLRQDSTNF